jgi:hypothetical protein
MTVERRRRCRVMAALVAAIHAFLLGKKTWVAGPSPAMTRNRRLSLHRLIVISPLRHGRACRGHPRLPFGNKAWVAGPSPAMTAETLPVDAGL